jgi:hypothetical protein
MTVRLKYDAELYKHFSDNPGVSSLVNRPIAMLK